MSARLHPSAVLYSGTDRPLPALSACEHYAGSEKQILKALALQAELGPLFDITCDCEDGAPAGQERIHAEMVAACIMSDANRHNRAGARIHDIRHPHWRDDSASSSAPQALASLCGPPKVRGIDDVLTQLAVLRDLQTSQRHWRHPVHV